MKGDEAGDGTHRHVPPELVPEERPPGPVAHAGGEGGPAIVPGIRAGRCRLVLTPEKPDTRQPRETGHRSQTREGFALPPARAQRVERHAGGKRGGGARQRQEHRAPTEEPAPNLSGHDIAHPGDPRVVADDGEDGRDRDERNEEPKTGRIGQ